MRRVLVWSALAFAACAHPKAEERKEADPPATEPATPRREAPREQHPPGKRPVHEPDARPPAEEGRPVLAMSPEGLMLEDGPRLIQEALARRGYLPKEHQTGTLDAETSAAIRKFQADEQLARTGAPDRETVRKLGLSIAEVFRKVTRDEE